MGFLWFSTSSPSHLHPNLTRFSSQSLSDLQGFNAWLPWGLNARDHSGPRTCSDGSPMKFTVAGWFFTMFSRKAQSRHVGMSSSFDFWRINNCESYLRWYLHEWRYVSISFLFSSWVYLKRTSSWMVQQNCPTKNRKFWSLGCPMLWAFDFAPDNSQPAIETTDELRHRYGHAMDLDGVSMGWSVEGCGWGGWKTCSYYPLVNVYITM